MQAGHSRIRQWARWVLVLFYGFAGLNHFWHPDFYLPLIPDYLPYPEWINILSGVAECALALGMAFPASRYWAAAGLVCMLVAFIPSHVYFLELGACVPEGLCTPPWVAWVRLLLIHPLLIGWAWALRT